MTKIGIVAPASRLDPQIAARVSDFAASRGAGLELRFHPQCFLSHGHFAGDDSARAEAFLEYANDPDLGAVWFARGGYGSGRIAARVLPRLTVAARKKTYLGYSDNGTLMAALYASGFRGVAHGPMPSDIARAGGEAAIERALGFLAGGGSGLEPAVQNGAPTAAFNITILSHMIGTPFQPNLAGHVVMLEEVAEAMYRIDRALLHITSNPEIRRIAGLMLGRCSAIPENDPAFEQSEEEVVKHWCHVSHIPYLGRADIGHDVHNKIVPFGRLLTS